MKKRFLSLASAAALTVSLFSAGLTAGAAKTTKTEYTMFQDFEAAAAADNGSTWSGGATIDLAVETANKNTGSQSIKLTMGEAHASGQVAQNFYPYKAVPVKDWSGQEGLSFWVKNTADKAIETDVSFTAGSVTYATVPIVVDGSNEVKIPGTKVYLLADGSSEEQEAAMTRGDGRISIPANFSGVIRIPFAEMAVSQSWGSELVSWANTVDMSNIVDLHFGFVVTEHTGKVLYMDTVQLYKTVEVDVPDEGDGDDDKPVTDPQLIQDFESDAIASDASIWGDGAHMTLASDSTVKNSGSKSVKITMGDKNGIQVTNNLYPTIANKDWSGQDGISFWFKNTAAKAIRIELYFETKVGSETKRFTTVGGKLYAVADGSETAEELTVAGDSRFEVKAGFTGVIRVPFSSFTDWTAEVNMSNITALAIGFSVADNKGDVVYVDTVRLYKNSDIDDGKDDGDKDPEPEVNPFMVQDFEKDKAELCWNRWADGAFADLTLEAGKGYKGSQAGKVVFGDVNGSQPSCVFYINVMTNAWKDTKGLKMYIKNPGSKSVAFGLNFEEKSGERWSTKVDCPAYLYEDGGKNVKKANMEGARIAIPAGFEGWLEVPFTSFSCFIPMAVDGTLDLSNITTILMDTDNTTAKGGTLLFDDIQVYKKSVQEGGAVATGDADYMLAFVALATAAGALILTRKLRRKA